MTYYTNAFMLYGTPKNTGTSTIKLTVSNEWGIDSRDITIAVSDVPVIATYYLPDGVKGEEYHANLYARDNVPANKWKLQAGDLPEGLKFSASGDIDGIPTQAGTYEFDVVLSNASIDRAKTFTLLVNEKPEITTSSALPDGKQNAEYPMFVTVFGIVNL